MKKSIEVQNLVKSYGTHKAVDDISFYVEEGKLFSLLGTNGAGKSTTINVLCGLLNYQNGDITIAGYQLGKQTKEIHRQIGIVFQDNFLDILLTVRENLEIRGGFYYSDKQELQEAIERVIKTTDLTDFIDRPYGKLSGGQKRRADIARALVHQPKILFLDEPTTGLDPKTRIGVWKMISRLQKELGTTIFLTTHYMEETADSDYVVIIDKGKIIAKGTPLALKNTYAKDSVRLTFIPEQLDTLKQVLEQQGIQYQETSERLLIAVTETLEALPILALTKPYITGFEVINGTMDDVFLKVTKQQESEGGE